MADEYGYVKISRKAYETDLFWNERRVFSRWEAWEDLIQMAAWRPYRKIVKGEIVSLGRGQLLASERFLAARWRWSRGKVRRFFELLVEMERIEISDQYADHIGRVVTLLNYDKYQIGGPVEGPEIEPAADQSRTSDGPPADQREDNKEEINTSSTTSTSRARARARRRPRPAAGVPRRARWCRRPLRCVRRSLPDLGRGHPWPLRPAGHRPDHLAAVTARGPAGAARPGAGPIRGGRTGVQRQAFQAIPGGGDR